MWPEIDGWPTPPPPPPPPPPPIMAGGRDVGRGPAGGGGRGPGLKMFVVLPCDISSPLFRFKMQFSDAAGYETLQEHFSDICESALDPSGLARGLFQKKLISAEAREAHTDS